ncbi:unnamed protein product [Arctogadus glacialis]
MLLPRYNIVLFGAVDGYSRKIMCLNAATNNLASTAFAAFKQATERHGIPSRVRADQGSENVEIARFMFTTRGTDRGSFMSGKSVHNQRIERLWRDVRTCVTSKYYNVLRRLEQDQLLDVSSTALVPLWILMDRRWFSNNRLLPNMTTFFSNSSRQRGVLAPLYPMARIHQTKVGSLVPLIRQLHLNR